MKRWIVYRSEGGKSSKDQRFPRFGGVRGPSRRLDPAATILPLVGTSIGLPWLFALLGGALAGAASSCGDGGEGGDEEPPSAAVVELGTGTVDFEPLADESDLILVAGPQGGHHFVVHARMRGLLPGDPSRPGLVGNPATRFTVTDQEGGGLDVGMAPYRLGYEQRGDDYFLPSARIIQVLEQKVPELYGQRVRIAVDVTDAEDRTASDGRWVVAVHAFEPDAGTDQNPRSASERISPAASAAVRRALPNSGLSLLRSDAAAIG